ncbi:MAG: hypothetical protein AAFU73_16970 [Planctomycetota bacterium]
MCVRRQDEWLRCAANSPPGSSGTSPALGFVRVTRPVVLGTLTSAASTATSTP